MRRILVLLAASLLFIAACGGDDDDAAPKQTTTTTEATEDTTIDDTTVDDTAVEDTTPGQAGDTDSNGKTAEEAVADYVDSVLLWPKDYEVAAGDSDVAFVVTSESLGEADVTVSINEAAEPTGNWYVTDVWTFDDTEGVQASVKLGSADHNDYVRFPFGDEDLTPQLALSYVQDDGTLGVESQTGDKGAEADFKVDTGGADVGERYLLITWRTDDGVAVEAWNTVIPAGEFAAG